MKVKIGGVMFDSAAMPMMIVFDEDEKKLLAEMPDDQNVFCAFPQGLDPEQVRGWMTMEAKRPSMELMRVMAQQ